MAFKQTIPRTAISMDTLGDLVSVQQPIKPIFKSKRKVAKGKRRIREAEIQEIEEKQIENIIPPLGTSKVSDSPKTFINASRWSRYSALGGSEQEDENIDEIKQEQNIFGDDHSQPHDYIFRISGDKPMNANEQEYMVLYGEELPPLVSANTSHTRLNVPTNKTFSSKESYFRNVSANSVSLEKKYTDKYGNLSYEEENRVNFENSKIDRFKQEAGDDLLMELSDEVTLDIPFKKSKQDLEEMYDSEVSIESGHETHVSKVRDIAGFFELSKDLSERFMKLDSNIRKKEVRSTALKESLASLELKRQRVISEL